MIKSIFKMSLFPHIQKSKKMNELRSQRITPKTAHLLGSYYLKSNSLFKKHKVLCSNTKANIWLIFFSYENSLCYSNGNALSFSFLDNVSSLD